MSAFSNIYAGDHATAIRHAQMAIALSPRDPHLFFVEHARMGAHLFRRELIEACALAADVLGRQPRHASALKLSLAIFGHSGRKEEVARQRQTLLEVEPDATIRSVISRPPLTDDDKVYYAEGLRLAGLPE